jgi:hypothetical protein
MVSLIPSLMMPLFDTSLTLKYSALLGTSSERVNSDMMKHFILSDQHIQGCAATTFYMYVKVHKMWLFITVGQIPFRVMSYITFFPPDRKCTQLPGA